MPDPKSRRLPVEDREADLKAFTSLKAIATYAPPNAAYSVANITTAQTAMATAQTSETTAENALNSARDNAVAAEHAFHEKILGAKAQVVAQFGENSNEIQALGLKKKSEYAKPKARTKATATAK
ncbi:MAG TPA: hypothetical protein VK178_17830 [Opitutaceae bacterium]|nr:hypothetical protein [Opitutaceae bacterium]